MTGEYTYISPPSDRMGRHREIAELMNRLFDEYGPGKFTHERIPEGNASLSDFSNTIRWRWRT